MSDYPVNLKTQRTTQRTYNALMNAMATQTQVTFEDFEYQTIRGIPVRIEYVLPPPTLTFA